MSETQDKLTTYRLDKIERYLETLHNKADNIIEHQHKLDKRQSLSELKSGLFGTIGGFLSVSVVLFREWLKTHKT